MSESEGLGPSCPLPIEQYPTVLLAHGGGGTLMHQLIGKVFRPAFRNPLLGLGHDGAVLPPAGHRLAFTTDSFVVRPLFFPGGDIGSLAVHGTVNDLAMCGARPLYLSAGFILEEGLPTETLWRIVHSMGRAADAAGVQLVTGDTKVVERGKGDGVFINTSGVGVIEHDLTIAPQSVRPGDLILLNGDIGRHGIAIMAVREGLAFGTGIESDSAALSGLVMDLLKAGVEITCLRDLTRGGLSSALVEIAETARVQIAIDERSIPIREGVQGACEILGLDPLYVANEGRFVAFVPLDAAERALSIMQRHPLGRDASLIGRVGEGSPGLVTMTTAIGGTRVVDVLSGEQLPRIC
jgi:hydrogenase expression/formation protein HypE